MRIGNNGNVGIGTGEPSVGEQPLKLDVEGAVGASHYCDQNGNNCTAASNLGGGGGYITLSKIEVKEVDWSGGYGSWEWEIWYH